MKKLSRQSPATSVCACVVFLCFHSLYVRHYIGYQPQQKGFRQEPQIQNSWVNGGFLCIQTSDRCEIYIENKTGTSHILSQTERQTDRQTNVVKENKHLLLFPMKITILLCSALLIAPTPTVQLIRVS